MKSNHDYELTRIVCYWCSTPFGVDLERDEMKELRVPVSRGTGGGLDKVMVNQYHKVAAQIVCPHCEMCNPKEWVEEQANKQR